MKQLKFMLAAATAIGIATAAQAATTTSYLVGTEAIPENFDAEALQGKNPVGTMTGYSFDSETATDNESLVKDQVLNVNTGTDPLLRHLNADAGNAVDLTADGFESLYIDTKVQFTVTPEGDTVTAGDDDKLMIYLKEVPADGETPASTKLMVKAGKVVVDEVSGDITGVEPGDFEVTAEGLTIVPNQWYNLRVYAVNDNGLAVFTIFVGDESLKQLKAGVSLGVAGDVDGFKFPSLQGIYDETSNPDALSLTYVGFAGEGKIDDLRVATVTTVTTVDFTFTWSTAGISSVTYTIGNSNPAPVNSGDKIANLAPNTVLTIAIKPADWYKVNDGATLTYTADKVGASANLDGLVTKTAAVVDGKVEVTESTKPADVGIKTGSFAADTTSVAELNKVLTWATAKAGAAASAAGTLVGQLDFTDETETPVEQAYLLNCALTEDAIKEAKDNFKFVAFDVEDIAAWIKDAADALNDKGYNGKVTVEGAATLGVWGAPDENSKFYRAVLTK